MSSFTIQDIFLKFGKEYIKTNKLSKEQWKVYNAIIKCKTKELGIHTKSHSFRFTQGTHRNGT